MEKISSVFAHMQPRMSFVKPRKKEEEVKELLQNPSDPLAKYPLRAFGYSNEVGAAVSAMPGWGKAAEAALWVPALMYLGADIYDKYSRGKEGNYSKASVATAVEQATFQGLASVLLPTAAVKIGQNLTAYVDKYDGTNLTASAKEELYRKLLDDFDKGKFVKKDFNMVKNKVLDEGFDKLLTDAYHDYNGKPFKKFFTHSHRPINAATSNKSDVLKFVETKAKEFYELQNVLESGENLSGNINKTVKKLYDASAKKLEEKVSNLIKQNPSFIIKKILNSNDPKYRKYAEMILASYPNVDDVSVYLKVLANDEKASKAMLEKLMAVENGKQEILNFTQMITRSRETLRKLIKRSEMKIGWTKTIAGFITLGLLAVPIDHFVHKYIIKKFVKPGLENIENNKLSFKKHDRKV